MRLPLMRILGSLALLGTLGLTAIAGGPTTRAGSPPVQQPTSSAQHATPVLTANQTRVQPGQIVTLSGRDFRPGTTVAVSMGGVNTGAGGSYGTAVADAAGRFAVDVLLLRAPDGSPVRPGALVLVAHDASDAQKATVRLQVVAAPPSAPSATIQVPAPAAVTTMPLHVQARVGRPGEQVTVVVHWGDGTHVWATFRTLRGTDGRGLLVGTLDHDSIIPHIAHPTDHAATLELRDRAGRLLASERITILDPGDPTTRAVRVYWIQGERLLPATVRVVRTPRVAAAALDALLWGPPAGSPATVTTALPTPAQVLSYPGRQADWGPRVTLRSLRVAGGVATADFSRELRAYGGGSTRVALMRQQITQTLLQFPSIHEVRITIEGSVSGVLEP